MDKEINDYSISNEENQWENLSPSNDFIFSKLMRNVEICKEVIEILLDIKIDHIEYPEEEKSIKIDADAKSVRLDVYVNDLEKTVYNIEMQTVPQTYLAKRSRYYQGMIDLNLIEKGELYNNLKTSYVIFICTFDAFKEGRSVYRFENLCIDDPKIPLNDGTYKYFFNTKGKSTVSKELRQLLDIFENKYPKGEETSLTAKIRKELKRIKANKEWRVEYMMLYLRDKENIQKGYDEGMEKGLETGMKKGIEKGLEKGMKRGIEKGLTRGRMETARNMAEMGMDIGTIAKALKEDVEVINRWLIV